MKFRFGKQSYANDRRKLNRLLKRNGIDFSWSTIYDGYQWHFPSQPQGDAVIHQYSYGSKYGHFETMGCDWDNGDVTELTAQELIDRLLPRE